MGIEWLREEIEQAAVAAHEGPNVPLSVSAKEAVYETLELLDAGKVRVAEPTESGWQTHSWVKQAILLYFKLSPMAESSAGALHFYDKIPLKQHFVEQQVRAVPPAVARYGSFMEPGVVLMPSYVNIGAYIGSNTMVDTWATVGSCAQIGHSVHLSGGVGIGGVLEPPSATPVIIEDGAFVGSRCIVVEGVHVGKEAVLAANVTLTASTPIIDAREGRFETVKGHVPAGAVVVPGVREKAVDGGKIHLSCAYIIGNRSSATDRKVSLNQTLREFSLSV